MPNWCDTTYKCVGEKEELDKLEKAIKTLEKMKEPYVKNGFGKLWLGCVINYLGGDWEKFQCRGEITDYDRQEDVLEICQNTAWCEQEGFRHFIEQKFPSIRVYYKEEEPGCGVYYTNDEEGRFFPEQFLLEDGDIWEYFEDIKGLADYLSQYLKTEVKSDITAISEAIDKHNEDHEEDGSYLYLHEFSVIQD